MENQEVYKIKKERIWQFSTAILGALLIISIFTDGFGINKEDITGKAIGTNPTAAGIGTSNTGSDVDISNNYFRGEEDAPVTMIEFSDFQCPFCGRFFTQTLPLIEEQYLKTGKVKFVYKDFPLESIHPMALPAALAARCAGEQGKFWEYHDIIFENQALLSDSSLKQWASDLGLNTGDFNSCLDSQKYLSEIRKDLQEGEAAGIRGTPGFLINGQLISGAQPFNVFQQAIESQL